ncbi:hypothetical protein B7494_g5759 [Chlorociboria aeruginascens]|nr:hypothetical protein B7494_g5759 [Chlorociboria aeruginascens]
MVSLSVPTTIALSPSQRVPSSNSAVCKILNRLSRPSLLSLVLDWLDGRNQEITAPYLAEEGDDGEQDLYPPAQTLEELREIYTKMQACKGGKRDVVDRIVEGDWREGITLYQLAMADMQYLYDHPNSQKWTALKIVRLESEDSVLNPAAIPRFHPSTFLQNLQREILPDVKAHYNFDRHASLPLLLLRIYILDSPYNTNLALPSSTATTLDSTRTFYIAFPDSSPYIYVSLTTSTGPSLISDFKSLRKLTLDGIPKAFSRPRERYKLESTQLSAKNLAALVRMRGSGRTNAANGGWGMYAEDKDTPLNTQLPTPFEISEDELALPEKGTHSLKRRSLEPESIIKRRKFLAKSRFGPSAKLNDECGIERFDIRLEDHFLSSFNISEMDEEDELNEPIRDQNRKKGRKSTITMESVREGEGGEGWRPDIRITFQGGHVFAGIRELVEKGVVNGERMPGWMTGEEGISVGVVREGRIKGFKGSGLS